VRTIKLRRFLKSIGLMILVLALFLSMVACSPAGQEPLTADLVGAFEPPAGFQRADGTLTLTFPQDFGPHPDFQTEWWYYTGNLEDGNGHHFGYQLTFFRRALLPAEQRLPRQSKWASDQVYMAHFALSDIAGEKHYSYERFNRGSAGLAGAQSSPFQVWLDDWQVVQTSAGQYRLIARQDGIEIDLVLQDVKGPILHGDQGYSQKGPEPGNASYYLSQTRLESSGSVRVENDTYQVAGLSWMDHEFSTSALSTGQIGWDWFSIQLDDGSELMVFQIRREDGTIDPYSSGTIIYPDGSTMYLSKESFEINVKDTWTSQQSGAEYPSAWRVTVPEFNLDLEIKPYLSDQEMVVSFVYWEGAVQVIGEMNGTDVKGDGYVELTGYAGSMEGEF
jgi:predicted secreted hydrolase